MRKLLAVGVAVLALAAACGREGDPTADFPRDLGECEWVRDITLPQAEPGSPQTISQEDVDRVVARVPDDIKGPIRTIFESARELQERTRDISDLPPSEQAALAAEIVQEYQERVPAAIQDFQSYVAENCPSITGGARD